jgi:hypothetical protein
MQIPNDWLTKLATELEGKEAELWNSQLSLQNEPITPKSHRPNSDTLNEAEASMVLTVSFYFYMKTL